MGEVGIVTLGRDPWVKQSASQFLPDLDLEALLHELNIPVVYARNCMTARHAKHRNEGGVNLYTMAKILAMKKVLKKFHRRGGRNDNVISIGDSDVERDAVKELLW